jgi:hypothetical protein
MHKDFVLQIKLCLQNYPAADVFSFYPWRMVPSGANSTRSLEVSDGWSTWSPAIKSSYRCCQQTLFFFKVSRRDNTQCNHATKKIVCINIVTMEPECIDLRRIQQRWKPTVLDTNCM